MLHVIESLQSLATPLQRTTVAIGVFDGVHRGHQEILRQTAREAHSRGFMPVVLTFDIHPSELFAPEHAPPYIGTIAQRAHWVKTLGGGIETMVIARFDKAFASLSPEAFVSEVLENRLGAKQILVGTDFCYGKGRAGTVMTLRKAGDENGFEVTVVPPILVNGARVSSTQVRTLISEGDISAAAALLGHPFCIEGQIVRGKQLGRTLGYPTANLQPTQSAQLLPANGVYAAWALLDDGRKLPAAVSVGTNPTTDSDNSRKIEAYLMDDFHEEIYGAHLQLEFREKVRDEAHFASLDVLITQMASDVTQISQVLASMSG